MSKGSFDTLSNRLDTKEVPTETVIAGSAKAWVNFNGTGTVAIRDSFNVTSITDNGTGDYTINYTNNMPNANYAAIGMWGGASTGDASYNTVTGGYVTTPPTVSATRILVRNSTAAALTDSDYVSVAILSN